jgi:FkbM family methyltransferase
VRGGAGRVGRGPAAGIWFDCGETHPGFLLGTSEPEVQAFVVEHLRPGDVFYDVGSLAGFFSLLAGKIVGPTGAVYAFEPVPSFAELIRQNAARNGYEQVQVMPAAVWSSAGEAEFLMATDPITPGRSRLAAVTAGGDDAEPDVFGESIVVSRVAIDDLVESGALRPPSAVKLDVEAAELEALRGMRRTIERYRPALMIELHWTGPEFVVFARDHLAGYDVVRVGSDGPIGEPVMMHVVAVPRS